MIAWRASTSRSSASLTTSSRRVPKAPTRRASLSNSAMTGLPTGLISSMRPRSEDSCSRPNWQSKLMPNSRQIWPKSRKKSAKMTMSTTLNCGTSSNKRLNWRRARRPPAKVSPRPSRSASASSSRRRTSSTSSGRTWSERSKK